MATPGEYVADQTEGIIDVTELPPARVVQRTLDRKRHRCPACPHTAFRVRGMERTLHDLGDVKANRPIDIHVVYSQHFCSKCRRYFNADMTKLAPPASHYTHRVIRMAVRLVVEDGLPYRSASWHLWRDQRVFVPFATIQNWVEAAGKKSGRAA